MGVPNSLMTAKPYAHAQIISSISQLINSAAATTAAITPLKRRCSRLHR